MGTDDEAVEAMSLRLEQETGYDSIPTIRRVYDRTDAGAYICCFPDCGVARRDAIVLWRHVHFGPHKPHPFSSDFDAKASDLAAALHATETQRDAAHAVIRRLLEGWEPDEPCIGEPVLCWFQDNNDEPEPVTPAEAEAIAHATRTQP